MVLVSNNIYHESLIRKKDCPLISLADPIAQILLGLIICFHYEKEINVKNVLSIKLIL